MTLPSRTPRFRMRTPSRVARIRPVSPDTLGCVVVRRITDDAGRAWRVREFRSTTGAGLFFRCEIPGIRSETRAACVPLESLAEDDLVQLLQMSAE